MPILPIATLIDAGLEYEKNGCPVAKPAPHGIDASAF